MTPGGLTIAIDDSEVTVSMTGGGRWTLPVGPATLVDGPLERADHPRAEQLTNALGMVADHLDDILLESPMVAAAPEVNFSGPHAVAFARVELGTAEVPGDYVLERADADEVFRTLVAEPTSERRHNPGLEPEHVDTIIGTCCVILAVMRRLELHHVGIDATGDGD